jgi:hypothetical protein
MIPKAVIGRVVEKGEERKEYEKKEERKKKKNWNKRKIHKLKLQQNGKDKNNSLSPNFFLVVKRSEFSLGSKNTLDVPLQVMVPRF